MVGDPGTVNVANAYAMGVRGFDTDAALQLMKTSADDPNHTQRWALSDWINLHFVGNAATTLEYAMADFALAQYAQALGDTASYQKYLARSDYWRESWNPADGYIEPRVAGAQPGADAARIYEVQIFGPTAPTTDLALAGTATASASCSANEGPEKAINGTWNGGSSDKWCDNISSSKWWQVNLGSAQSIDKIVVYHAGAGGESNAWDTQDFTLDVSTDASTWTTVATVKGNKDDISTHSFTATSARYVRLSISAAIQGSTPGAWDCQPFDPAAECGFIEGNGAQYVWMVPHDLEGAARADGRPCVGRDAPGRSVQRAERRHEPALLLHRQRAGARHALELQLRPSAGEDAGRRATHRGRGIQREPRRPAGQRRPGRDLGVARLVVPRPVSSDPRQRRARAPRPDLPVGDRSPRQRQHAAASSPPGRAPDAPYVQSLQVNGAADHEELAALRRRLGRARRSTTSWARREPWELGHAAKRRAAVVRAVSVG